MNPLINGITAVKSINSYAFGELKNSETGFADKNINNPITVPLIIDTSHASLRYFEICFFSWTRYTFIPVSVTTSKNANTRVAIAKAPNSLGAKILARIASLPVTKILETTRKTPIHETPLTI